MVGDVYPDQLCAEPLEPLCLLAAAPRGEVVDHYDAVALLEEPPGDVASYEAGSPGDDQCLRGQGPVPCLGAVLADCFCVLLGVPGGCFCIA